jgi:hypothetical protein
MVHLDNQLTPCLMLKAYEVSMPLYLTGWFGSIYNPERQLEGSLVSIWKRTWYEKPEQWLTLINIFHIYIFSKITPSTACITLD